MVDKRRKQKVDLINVERQFQTKVNIIIDNTKTKSEYQKDNSRIYKSNKL
jgi:hypothetical protein